MSLPTTSRAWIVAEKPTDQITPSTFKLVEKALPELKDGEVLVKVTHWSCDPAMRTWIDKGQVKDRAYGPFPEEGDSMPSLLLGQVIASKAEQYKEGALVSGLGAWQEYLVLPAATLQDGTPPPGLSESAAISALGFTALTAYVGCYEIGKMKPEDVVVISGAAGATGSAAVQLAAKVIGCKRVIGIAGGQKKCDWVKSLGAHECLDYRSPTFAEDLVEATEGYVDFYFDNVSGPVLNLMFKRMARFSRIVACGAVSMYNSSDAVDMRNIFELISMRITMQGFICLDHLSVIPQAMEVLKKAIGEGKYIVEGTETFVPTKFEDVPETWQMLFTGGNQGKLIAKLV